MFLEKDKLINLLDREVIENFKKVISKEPLSLHLYYGNLNSDNIDFKTNLHNLLWSFAYNIEKIIDDIETLDGVFYEKDLLFLFNSISKLNEGIEEVKNKSKWINFEFENNSLFFNNLVIFWKKIVSNHGGIWIQDMNEYFLNDDQNFNYYRALLVHPFSTNRHPRQIPRKDDIFKEYKYTQSVLDFFINDEFQKRFNEDIKTIENNYPVIIRIHLVDAKESDINGRIVNRDNNNSYFLILDLNDVIKYFKKKYDSIISATKSLEEKNNELEKNADFKLIWNADNSEFLKQIIEIHKKQDLGFKDFQDLLDQYELFLNDKLINDNNKILEEYFNKVFFILRQKIKYIENSIYHKEYKLINFILSLSYSKKINESYNYSIEKIFPYLDINRNAVMSEKKLCVSDNNKCAINEVLYFYENFANKYVKINLFNKDLTFLEIKLLFHVAMWKYNEEKCETHMI